MIRIMSDNGILTVLKACRWVNKHPEAWEHLKDVCNRLNLEGYLITRDTVYTIAMQLGLVMDCGAEYKRDHNLWSVLTRWMVMERPSLCGAITFRKSDVDTVDLDEAYQTQIGSFPFVAGSLSEAKELYAAGWH